MPKTLRINLLALSGAGSLLLLLCLTVSRVQATPTVTPGISQGRVTNVAFTKI